jgi:Zn-dependent M16 (insulinase) family peptidase
LELNKHIPSNIKDSMEYIENHLPKSVWDDTNYINELLKDITKYTLNDIENTEKIGKKMTCWEIKN